MDQDKLQQIKEQLNSVPAEPGVYLWKDKSGTVIYVGKAKQLQCPYAPVCKFPRRPCENPPLGVADRFL